MKEPTRYDIIRHTVQEIRQQAAAQADAARYAAAQIELAAMRVLDDINALDEGVSDCPRCWCDTCALLYICPQAPENHTAWTPWPCTGCERGQRHKPVTGERCKDYVKNGQPCQTCLCYACARLLDCPRRPESEAGIIWPCRQCAEGVAFCTGYAGNGCEHFSPVAAPAEG